MPQSPPQVVLPTLSQSFLQVTVDQLKWYAQVFHTKPPTRKGELVVLLVDRLTSAVEVERLWEQLSAGEQQVVAEVVHRLDGRYRTGIIQARYPGALPPKNPHQIYSYTGLFGRSKTPARPYDVFFAYSYDIGQYVPSDLMAILKTVAPEPAPDVMASQDEPPPLLVRAGAEAPKLEYAKTEAAIFHDLAATLYLIQSGKITVSATTKLPTLPSLRALRPRLLLGEYFEDDYDRADDAIRPFALIMLVQAARWAAPAATGGKLELTKAGAALLPGPLEARHVRDAWQRWIKSDVLDELGRIRSIKGQQSRNVHLTKPSARHVVIDTVLQETPTGRWIELAEFFRYMHATDQSPTVERSDEHVLHIGSQGDSYYYYGDVDYWGTIVGPYLRAVLWEYVATLGILDIAYTRPDEADFVYDSDVYELLNTDYLSRYDGLYALRITDLGAYVLGLTDQYTPQEVRFEASAAQIQILPNLDIVIVDPVHVSLNDRAFLERLGPSESENVYRLNRSQVLEVVEQGLSLQQIQAFLAGKSALAPDVWPQTVRVFFEDIAQRMETIRESGRMVLLESDDPYVLTELAHSSELRQFARLGTIDGTTILLVPEEREATARRQLRKLGYILSKRR